MQRNEGKLSAPLSVWKLFRGASSTSLMGHHRPIRQLPSMSASPPTAAVTRRLRMSRKVPVPDPSHPDYQKLELSAAGRVDRCLRAQITRVTLDIGKPRAN